MQGEETGWKVDLEYRKRIVVPESSDVNWGTELEIIVKTSTVRALIAKVIVHVVGPTKALHTIITTSFVLYLSLLSGDNPGWEQ